jgi:hypothetical protein
MSPARTERFAALVFALALTACSTTSQSPTTAAEESQGFTARNDALISMAAPVEEQALLIRGEPAPDPEHEGLTRYEFTADGASFSLSISLDPAAPMTGGQESGDALVVAFTADDNTFVSSAGECAVTFVNYSDAVIDGELECEDVPAEGTEDLAEAAGIFAFAP